MWWEGRGCTCVFVHIATSYPIAPPHIWINITFYPYVCWCSCFQCYSIWALLEHKHKSESHTSASREHWNQSYSRCCCFQSNTVPLCFSTDAEYNVTVRNAFKVHDRQRNKWYLMVAKTPQIKQRWLKAFADERRRVQDDAENSECWSVLCAWYMFLTVERQWYLFCFCVCVCVCVCVCARVCVCSHPLTLHSCFWCCLFSFPFHMIATPTMHW